MDPEFLTFVKNKDPHKKFNLYPSQYEQLKIEYITTKPADKRNPYESEFLDKLSKSNKAYEEWLTNKNEAHKNYLDSLPKGTKLDPKFDEFLKNEKKNSVEPGSGTSANMKDATRKFTLYPSVSEQLKIEFIHSKTVEKRNNYEKAYLEKHDENELAFTSWYEDKNEQIRLAKRKFRLENESEIERKQREFEERKNSKAGWYDWMVKKEKMLLERERSNIIEIREKLRNYYKVNIPRDSLETGGEI